MHWRIASLLAMVMIVVGCAGDASPPNSGAKSAPAAPAAAWDKQRTGKAEVKEAGGEANKPEEVAPRKIVYTGRMELVVDDLDQAEQQMHQLVKDHKAYIARSERTGSPGAVRYGTWTLRIPVVEFDAAREAFGKLGEVRSNTLDSDDITDRYFDMQAEATNLEAREKALRKLYEEKVGGSKLADLLDVDRELSRVRGEINLRKGQLQRWDKETAFATLTLTMSEHKGYVPETAPNYTTRIRRTFDQSTTGFVETGKALVLIAVASTPWLGVLAALALPLWMTHRIRRRRQMAVPPLPQETPPAKVSDQ